MSAPERVTEFRKILFRTKAKTGENELLEFIKQEIPDAKVASIIFCKTGAVQKPYGFITFDTVDQANKAISVLNEKVFFLSLLFLSFFFPFYSSFHFYLF